MPVCWILREWHVSADVAITQDRNHLTQITLKLWQLTEIDVKQDLSQKVPHEVKYIVYKKIQAFVFYKYVLYIFIRLSFGVVVGTMNKTANAMENGEFDFDGTVDKKVRPLL